jgi:hypothetical protein
LSRTVAVGVADKVGSSFEPNSAVEHLIPEGDIFEQQKARLLS